MALPAEPIGKSALVVDDHPLYRAGLILALGPLSIRFEEAAGLLGALDALSLRRFDLVLYDWHLPDGGGCKGLVAIRQIAPDVPVVVIMAMVVGMVVTVVMPMVVVMIMRMVMTRGRPGLAGFALDAHLALAASAYAAHQPTSSSLIVMSWPPVTCSR